MLSKNSLATYVHEDLEVADTVKLEELQYTNRYYSVMLKEVVFTRNSGKSSFSMQGIIVNGQTFSYFFSECVTNVVTPGRSVHASCLSVNDIRTAIETGYLHDRQVFFMTRY